jgi:hypothetical protein
MTQTTWQHQVSALWIFQILNFIAILVVPYSFSIVSAEFGDGLGALIVFYFFLTCLMIWLTLVLKPEISRWPTMLVGVFYSFVKVQWLIQGVSNGYAFEFIFNEAWGLLAALLLVWYGWKVPKGQSVKNAYA